MRNLRSQFIQSNTVLWILFCLWIFFPPSPTLGQEYGSGAEKIRVLKIAAAFEALPGIEVKDAQLALQRIIRKTMIKETDPYDAKLDFFLNWDNAEETLSSGDYQFIALTGLDYADMIQRVNLRPVIILSRLDHPTESLLLITRKGVSLTTLGPNPKLLLEEGRAGDFSRIWLDTVLVKSGLNDHQKLFSEIKYARKPSRILLPVFFGKADACVITKSAFDLMSELNPQLGKALSVQRESEGYIFWMICATDFATPRDIAALAHDAITSVTETEVNIAVQQALTIVQMKRLFSYKKEYLQATLDLFESYRRLRFHQPKQDVVPRNLKNGETVE